MKNILNIARHDLKKITGSVVAIIVIMGLCLVPCSYAWFNILSNWSPYDSEATGRIPVAVANADEGAKFSGLNINVGEKIIDALEANDDIGWVFTDDEEAAKAGVLAGDYYAALIVPENFSQDVLSFTHGDLTTPVIRYYENEKKNAIAPKITGKAKTALQEEVNAAFVETLASYVSDAASVAEANGTDPTELLGDLSDRIEELSGDINSCVTLANSAAGLTDASGNLLEVSDNFIGSTQDVIAANDKLLEAATKELEKDKKVNTEAIKNAATKAKDTASSLKTMKTALIEALSASDIAYKTFLEHDRNGWVKKADQAKSDTAKQAEYLEGKGFTALASEFTDLSATMGDISTELSALNESMDYTQREAALNRISELIDKAISLTEDIEKQIRTDIDKNISTALSNTRTSLASFRKAMSSADKDLSSLSNTMDSYTSSLGKLKKSIDSTSAGLSELKNGADSIASLLNDASGNELLNEISKMMGNDEAAVAEYLANPVKMKTEIIWPIETYGSAMAPFYTVLAQWVGALLTAVLIKVKVKKRDDLESLRLHESFFGRFGIYLMIGIAQALIVALGDLLYVHIQCRHPLLFVLAACVNGLVFMMINYGLVFALDNIGMGAGVILLVLQVAGSGGTYPVEVLPPVFKAMYPFMPFRYSMDAMRECIGGMYGDVYWRCLGILMIFFVIFIMFGLAFYKPALWLNNLIAESKAKSEIML